MASIPIPMVYDELLDYLTQIATPEEILAFNASEQAHERAACLLDKNSAGTLKPDETLELQHMLYLDRKISALKARAAATLKRRQFP